MQRLKFNSVRPMSHFEVFFSIEYPRHINVKRETINDSLDNKFNDIMIYYPKTKNNNIVSVDGWELTYIYNEQDYPINITFKQCETCSIQRIEILYTN